MDFNPSNTRLDKRLKVPYNEKHIQMCSLVIFQPSSPENVDLKEPVRNKDVSETKIAQGGLRFVCMQN